MRQVFECKVLETLKSFGPGHSEEQLIGLSRRFKISNNDFLLVMRSLVHRGLVEQVGTYYWKIEREPLCRYRVTGIRGSGSTATGPLQVGKFQGQKKS